MSDWNDFFVAAAGAAAALAGLVFVGVSINLDAIMASPRLPSLAREAFAVLLTALVVALLQLVPGQPPGVAGAELLVVGLVAWAGVTALHRRRIRTVERAYRAQAVAMAALGQAAVLPVAVGGALLCAGHDGGRYWLVPGVVGAFAAAGLIAWVLLVEIKR